jgi:hypothetical protein
MFSGFSEINRLSLVKKNVPLTVFRLREVMYTILGTSAFGRHGRVYVHSARPCPCCTSISMPHVLCCMSMSMLNIDTGKGTDRNTDKA